jgi:endonuclease/exonuclease/phosphatase family metal-dependent hydrolase
MTMQLKIVSWNIWGGIHLPEIITCLKEANPDIIGLQEVLQDEGGANNSAKAIADAFGYTYIYETTTILIPSISHLLEEHKIEKNMEWGNAIISRYPILHSDVHVLSQERKRVALEATIKVDDTELRVFSTHLVFAPVQPSMTLETQSRNLLEVLPKEHGLVMGDFNTTPDSEIIQNMCKVMTNTESDPSKITADGKKIDYIFSTADIKVLGSGTLTSTASDHLPVYAIIEI